MKGSIILAGFAAGLAAAAPAPQGMSLDLDAVKAVPIPAPTAAPMAVHALSAVPTYNTAVAASDAAATATATATAAAKLKRDACQALPQGAGPVTSPDTAAAFLANSVYNQTADSAVIPQGYQQTFSNAQGSVSASSYMGYYTLNSYDTVQCAHYCDAADGCMSFNVFFERDPSVDPADACPNPTSTVPIKCTLWGLPINAAMANNMGQWRDQFQVLIAASNGYVSNAPPASAGNFTGPSARLGGAINAPLSINGVNPYEGMNFFTGPYDPSQCAAACQAKTAYAAATATNGTYEPCNFFASYVLSENNVPQGTYCAYYNQAFDRSYAVNNGQYDGEGNYYSVSQAYSYTLTNQDSGEVASS
ncbi:hypothetical protein MBLNU457_1863t1 [Dothideomycetes sp. NU457]